MAQTAGVKPMAIAGRVAIERERCLGMTDVERAWRKQWLKDQILAPNEPVHVEEYWRERTNIFRRIYRMPLDKIYSMLTPVLVRLHNTSNLSVVNSEVCGNYNNLYYRVHRALLTIDTSLANWD